MNDVSAEGRMNDAKTWLHARWGVKQGEYMTAKDERW